MNEFIQDDQLLEWLGELRLTGIRNRFDSLLDDAARQELNLRDFVIFLVREELNYKREARVLRRFKQARFPMIRELKDFDCEAQPSVNPDQLEDLATARWVAHGDNMLLLGPPGVGKTHLAIGIGRAAIRQGYSVRFITATALLTTLMDARENGDWDACLREFARPQLLIIDEFGYLPVDASAAHLLFQVVATRYEQGSVLLTSNQAISDWGRVLGDAVVATAILDRLLHHSQVMSIRGESYRLREKRRSGLVTSRTAAQNSVPDEPGAPAEDSAQPAK